MSEDVSPDFGRATCANCAYWKREAEHAIAKRQRLDKLLDSVDGGAGYWRATSRTLTYRLQREITKFAGMSLHRVQTTYLSTLEDYGRLLMRSLDRDEYIAAWKSKLWDVWTSLDDAAPQKDTIRKVWEQL